MVKLQKKAIMMVGAITAVTYGALSTAQAQDVPPTPDNTPNWADLYNVDPMATESPNPPEISLEGSTEYSATYKGKLIGLDIGRIKVKIEMNDNAYHIAQSVEQKGMARWFSNAHSTGESYGIFDEQGVFSQFYNSYAYEKDDDFQEIELIRTERGGRYRLWTNPVYRLWHSVTPEDTVNTVDPVSALIKLGFSDVPEGASPCDRVIEIFDGKRRYNMEMSDAGTKTFNRVKKGRYNGPSYKCSVKQVKLTGYRDKDLKEPANEGYVYLAEVPENIRTAQFAYVPVYMEGTRNGITASLQVKNPTFTLPDGTSVNMGRK